MTGSQLLRRAVEAIEGRGASLDSVLVVALEVLGDRFRASIGRAYLVDRATDHLAPSGTWRILREGLSTTLSTEPSEAEPPIARGRGLVGRAWLSGRPTWDPGKGAAAGGSPARVAIPLVAVGLAPAVVEFVLAESRAPDEAAMEDVEATARILGEMIVRLGAEDRLYQTRARMGALVDDIGEGVIVTDELGRIRSWNRKAARLLDREGEEVPVGESLAGFLAPELEMPIQKALDAASLGGGRFAVGGSVELHFPRIVRGGAPVTVALTSWDVGGGDPSYVFVLSGTSRMSGTGDTLAPAQAWPEPLIVLSGDTRWGGPTIISASPAFCRMTGFSPADLSGRSLTAFLGPQADEETIRTLREGFASASPFTTGFVAHRRGGDPFLVRLEIKPVRDAEGEISHFVAGLPEPARDEVLAEALRRAETDPLTGLANRLFFDKRLRRAMERVKKSPDPRYAVLFLDLDRFKEVNDRLGHMAGDRLLRAVARQLESAVRPGDVVARFGGDEFVVLLDLLGSPDDAVIVAGRIEERLAGPVKTPDGSFRVAASIGIAMSDAHYGHVEEIFKDADAAMYQAKRDGKGRYRIYDATLRGSVAAADLIREALILSLEKDQFRLHYQPLFDLASNRLSGFEALLRWEHPERGTVPAGEFIGQAEDGGVILQIGRWVIREACRQLASWRDQMGVELPVSLNVHLSARELSDPTLPSWIGMCLREFGAPASALRLEVPESVLFQRGAVGLEALGPLRALGVRIGIGDFGGSHASLTNLRRAPVDLLKLGRQFLTPPLSADGAPGGHIDEGAVSPILAMARTLGIEVVAAGVETALQRDALQRLSCPTGQGYLFSAPVEAVGAGVLLEEAWGGGEPTMPHLA